MQKLKGLWIPAEILLNEDLSDKEKILLLADNEALNNKVKNLEHEYTNRKTTRK